MAVLPAKQLHSTSTHRPHHSPPTTHCPPLTASTTHHQPLTAPTTHRPPPLAQLLASEAEVNEVRRRMGMMEVQLREQSDALSSMQQLEHELWTQSQRLATLQQGMEVSSSQQAQHV